MPLVIRDGANTPQNVTGLIIRDGANVSRTITELWIRDTTNTPRLVYIAGGGGVFTAAAVPTDPFGADNGTGTAVTETTTVTPTGGVAPYTYAWTLLSYTSGIVPVCSSPTTATTPFYQTGMAPGDFFIGVFRCTVTDFVSATATTDVTANFYSFGP